MNNIIYLTVLFLIIVYSSFSQILYNLDITVDIKNHTINGKAVIENSSNGNIRVFTQDFNTDIKKSIIEKGKTVSFSFTKRFPSYSANNMIGEDYVYLMNNWYPSIDKLAVYRLNVKLPENFVTVSEGEVVLKKNGEFSFDTVYPVEEIHLIASPDYVVSTKKLGDIQIKTFLFKEDKNLSEIYIKKAVEYISLYSKLIGDFPYKSFSIVENRFPTGYSMPTFTLIGKQIIKYPFILKTSLPHEILHQWFGCSVYVDFDKGNWSEGLTTYLSDHYLSKNPAIYRKKLLLKYMAFVNEKNEYSLKNFRFKKNPVDEAIGYGKSAMVFHMLRKKVGDKTFFEALNRFYTENKFKRASWKDIEKSFEKVSKKDFKEFFNQWVNQKGIPELKVSNADFFINKDGLFKINLRIDKTDGYKLDIPISVSSYYKTYTFLTNKENPSFIVKDIPLYIKIDEKYDLFRKLSEEEIAPVLYFLLGEEKPVIFVEKEKEDMYKPLLKMFKKAKLIYPKDFKYEYLLGNTCVICGKNNPVVEKVFGKKEKNEGFFVKGYKNPFSEEKAVFVLNTPSKDLLEKGLYLLKHYGGYTYISFGLKREKVFKNTQNGIKITLNEPSSIVTQEGFYTFNQMIDFLKDKKVIYIGEHHTKYEHHAIQYQIIKALKDRGVDIAIGMEMFGRDFQKYLDDYIDGKISETQFLRKTKYFTQWRYDYHLYKPILKFARENKIPVVALNLDLKLIEKVARKGIDSLTEEEKRKLPKEIDFSNLEYKNYLFRIYKMHSHGDLKKFINFYQSQLLWDETMAETSANYIKKHPKKTLIVLAGNGHLAYGYGIPDRVKRRVNVKRAIILQGEQPEKEKGDIFIFTEIMKGTVSKKLGVYVKETEKGLLVEELVKTSIAEKSGIKKGDLIVSFNGKPVKTVEDLKLLLINPPEKSFVEVIRKGEKIKIFLDFSKYKSEH